MGSKLKGVETRLTKVFTRAIMKAPAPSDDAVCALECATMRAVTEASQYAAGAFRFLVGVFGRFDDGQHMEESTMVLHSHTVDARAWQCKTVDIAQTPREFFR